MQARLDKVWRAREDAIVSVRPEPEIEKLSERRRTIRAEVERLEQRRQVLVDQSSRAADLRTEAAAAEERCFELRAQAGEKRVQIEVLPEAARRLAVKLHDEERVRAQAREAKPRPDSANHVLVPIGNGLIQDATDGTIYNRDGYLVVAPT